MAMMMILTSIGSHTGLNFSILEAAEIKNNINLLLLHASLSFRIDIDKSILYKQVIDKS